MAADSDAVVVASVANTGCESTATVIDDCCCRYVVGAGDAVACAAAAMMTRRDAVVPVVDEDRLAKGRSFSVAVQPVIRQPTCVVVQRFQKALMNSAVGSVEVAVATANGGGGGADAAAVAAAMNHADGVELSVEGMADVAVAAFVAGEVVVVVAAASVAVVKTWPFRLLRPLKAVNGHSEVVVVEFEARLEMTPILPRHPCFVWVTRLVEWWCWWKWCLSSRTCAAGLLAAKAH